MVNFGSFAALAPSTEQQPTRLQKTENIQHHQLQLQVFHQSLQVTETEGLAVYG